MLRENAATENYSDWHNTRAMSPVFNWCRDRLPLRDDPSWFRPEADIFVKSAQPWDYMNPDLPKYSAYPPGQAYEPVAGEPRQKRL